MSTSRNIILNHDFSQGTRHWSGNNCNLNIVTDKDGSRYANLTGRNEDWHSLDQDTKDRVLEGRRYEVSAWVRISGSGRNSVKAKMKRTYLDVNGKKERKYQAIFSEEIDGGKWYQLKGKFKMPTWPEGKTVFYIFGPEPEIDLHVRSVEIFCLDFPRSEIASTSGDAAGIPPSRLPGENQTPKASADGVRNPNPGTAASNKLTRSPSGDAAGNTNSEVAENNESLKTSTVQGANTNNINFNIRIEGRSDLGATDGVGNDPNSSWAKFGSFLRGLFCFACAL